MKNPFAVLGITPQIVARMDNEALYNLVRACYRALQQAHHPDKLRKQTETARRKSTERATEINLAYEKLNWAKDPYSFLLHKERYLKAPRREEKKLRDLQTTLETFIDKQREMADSFWQYLGYSQEQAARSDTCSCLKMPVSITLGIIDVAMRQNVRSEGWVPGLGYKEIRFDENSQMYYRLSRQRKFTAVNFIKLIGTIAKDKIDIDALLEKKPLKGVLYIQTQSPVKRSKSSKYLEVLNTIPISEFKWHCLPFLKPDIVEGHYLFSIHRKPSAMDKVFLEGIVSRMSKT
jgi:curved DNA-binding protein CbpA